MRTKTIIAIASLASLAAIGATTVQAERDIQDVDTSGDGYVSIDELKAAHSARIEEHFARVDTNADGLLSENEMAAAREARRDDRGKNRGERRNDKRDPAEMFSRLDADGSGGLSLIELDSKRFSPDQTAFRAADADGSGELDAAEMQAMMKARRGDRRGADRK